ncbi:guanine-specific ribonuclease N1 and T1 [Caballeronia terrestris]|uniref:Guanine-specific ribonuclease N1 and T1 n=1 Tax=Caballeronia terrestris TaxID=1226301 RepID=A0A158FFW4_9BURK|nr:guanine-specific ribonuclease N1 and T1 [Caballeronia terrestris]
MWFQHCILALFVVLSGCDKGMHGPDALDTAPGSSALAQPVQPAESPGRSASGGSVKRETEDGRDIVAVAKLPNQAIATLRLIESGGPYPFEKDGVVFGNRERLLPPHPRGYYHEYTVPTPRARDRGARRIVCGGPRRQIGECYYSDDHYASFKRIAG